MALAQDNLLTSTTLCSDLSDIVLNLGPLPTHIIGKINWNKFGLNYNGSNDKWGTQYQCSITKTFLYDTKIGRLSSYCFLSNYSNGNLISLDHEVPEKS